MEIENSKYVEDTKQTRIVEEMEYVRTRMEKVEDLAMVPAGELMSPEDRVEGKARGEDVE